MELISDTHCIVLHAHSIEDRDAWVDALNSAIAKLQYSYAGGGRGNAPWLEVLAAEANARKVRWQRREKRQLQKWLWKWKSNDGQINNKDSWQSNDSQVDSKDLANEDNNEGVDGDDDETANDEGVSNTVGEEAGDSNDFLLGIQNALDGGRSHAKTKRFEDALELRIGRLEIKQVALCIKDSKNDIKQYWLEDWMMRGFVGSSNELRGRLRFDLLPKLITDSTGHAIKRSISDFTGKEQYGE